MPLIIVFLLFFSDIDSENIVEDIAPEEGKYTYFMYYFWTNLSCTMSMAISTSRNVVERL